MKAKELNPELFGEMASVAASEEKSQLFENMKLGAPLEPLDFDEEVQSAKSELAYFRQEIQHLKNDQQETSQNTKLRLDRLQISLSRLEQSYNGFVQDMAEKVHQISLRFGEHKKYDQKVQELIDRHSSLLKGYEMRMGQTQKILAQKEAELVEVHALLNDARMELARLKRI